jgi:hypothetical protein
MPKDEDIRFYILFFMVLLVIFLLINIIECVCFE